MDVRGRRGTMELFSAILMRHSMPESRGIKFVVNPVVMVLAAVKGGIAANIPASVVSARMVWWTELRIVRYIQPPNQEHQNARQPAARNPQVRVLTNHTTRDMRMSMRMMIMTLTDTIQIPIMPAGWTMP
jgi:hypothetical protein